MVASFDVPLTLDPSSTRSTLTRRRRSDVDASAQKVPHFVWEVGVPAFCIIALRSRAIDGGVVSIARSEEPGVALSFELLRCRLGHGGKRTTGAWLSPLKDFVSYQVGWCRRVPGCGSRGVRSGLMILR